LKGSASSYQVVLGDAFEALPREVRAFHDGRGPHRWSGTATIRRGRGPLARLAALAFGLPKAGEAVPVSVLVEPWGSGEAWTRDFGGHVRRSTQWAGSDRGERLLFERFGPICVGAALVRNGDRLHLVQRRATCLGLPLPRWLWPSGEAVETASDGWFRFDVTIPAPLIGLVVAYRGHLMDASGAPGSDPVTGPRTSGDRAIPSRRERHP
jgi:hypothetical protein